MTDERSLLESESQRFAPPADWFDAVRRRKEQRSRRRRALAALVAIVVAGVGAFFLRSLRPSTEEVPATPIDLTQWHEVYLPSRHGRIQMPLQITPFGDGFAAVSATRIYLSSDGEKWTFEPGPAREACKRMRFTGIGTVGSRLIAFGTERSVNRAPTACMTDDGSTWRPASVAAPSSGRATITHVERVGDRYYGIGGMSSHNHIDGLLWTTSDGASWSLLPQESVFHGSALGMIDGVFESGSQTIAIGFETEGMYADYLHLRLWASADGDRWSELEMKGPSGRPTDYFRTVAPVDEGMIAVRSDGRIWFSLDGTSWSRAGRLPASSLGWDVSIVRFGTQYLGAAIVDEGPDYGLTVFNSDDGRDWVEPVSLPSENIGGSFGSIKIAVGTSRIVILDSNRVWISGSS